MRTTKILHHSTGAASAGSSRHVEYIRAAVLCRQRSCGQQRELDKATNEEGRRSVQIAVKWVSDCRIEVHCPLALDIQIRVIEKSILPPSSNFWVAENVLHSTIWRHFLVYQPETGSLCRRTPSSESRCCCWKPSSWTSSQPPRVRNDKVHNRLRRHALDNLSKEWSLSRSFASSQSWHQPQHSPSRPSHQHPQRRQRTSTSTSTCSCSCSSSTNKRHYPWRKVLCPIQWSSI